MSYIQLMYILINFLIPNNIIFVLRRKMYYEVFIQVNKYEDIVDNEVNWYK